MYTDSCLLGCLSVCERRRRRARAAAAAAAIVQLARATAAAVAAAVGRRIRIIDKSYLYNGLLIISDFLIIIITFIHFPEWKS
jgi:hypothetical protein